MLQPEPDQPFHAQLETLIAAASPKAAAICESATAKPAPLRGRGARGAADAFRVAPLTRPERGCAHGSR